MPDENLSVPNDPKLESCIMKVMGQGHDKSSAIAICRSSMNMSDDTIPYERYAFEPFASVDDVLGGQPVKIMPLGTFYRGNRKLIITADDLKQIAANTNSGLPRFRIPINENHSGVGKVGTVSAVEFNETGADGPGLYATQYELTDEGKKLVRDKRFDAVSPEVIWSKNDGAKYQDPTTGKWYDNVLVGLALTDKPFFGHDNVALFSDINPRSTGGIVSSGIGGNGNILQEIDTMADTLDPKPKRKNGYIALREKMKAKFDELMAMVTDSDGDGEPDMPVMHKGMMDAEAEKAGVLTAVTPAETTQETHMEDVTTPKPESFSVTAEEFAALKAKADKAEQVEKLAAELKAQADKFQSELTASNRARRRDQLTAHAADHFNAIPDKAETLAEKLQALEEKDPELFAYFDGLLNTVNNQIVTAGLFSQVASARKGGVEESFEALTDKVLKEKFNGDMAKYTDALSLAAKERPDLFTAYNETYAPSRR